MYSISIWNPLREIEAMQNRLRRSANLNADGRQAVTSTEWAPAVDISEDAREYLIRAELPEVNKEDVKLTVENGVLTLKGERKFASVENDRKYHRIERGYGAFTRSFAMPEDADPDKVAADFKDGVLNIHLPKIEARKPKQIEVAVD